MLIKKPEEIKSSEITDENLYFNRRNFIRGAILAATTTATGWLYKSLTAHSEVAQPRKDRNRSLAINRSFTE